MFRRDPVARAPYQVLSIALLCSAPPLILVLLGTDTRPAVALQGSIVEAMLPSPALQGNLVGDSPRRPIQVYLPPSYPERASRRYPVIYLLHGFQGNYSQWMAGGKEWNIRDAMDGLIAAGKVREMLLVMPDAKNKYAGSFYTNSPTTGNWEDFLASDLVAFIDKNYQTIPHASSRGIAGHSMGGYGASGWP